MARLGQALPDEHPVRQKESEYAQVGYSSMLTQTWKFKEENTCGRNNGSVNVDADAVFLPFRLRQKLSAGAGVVRV